MSKFNNSRHHSSKSRDGAQGSRNAVGFKSGGDAAHNASKGSKPMKNEKRSSRRHVNPMYIVIRKFWSIFGAYDEGMQNTQTKKATLNLAIRLCSKYYPDTFRFWQDLLDEANILLDSKRFNNYCNDVLKLDPQAVAEHIVVEGKATVNKVLKEGLENYGQKARMFGLRLYSYEKRKLYESKKDEATTDSPIDAELHGE
jgi:hypothetical protein